MISILTSKDDITGRQWPVCYSQLLCSAQSTLIISSFFLPSQILALYFLLRLMLCVNIFNHLAQNTQMSVSLQMSNKLSMFTSSWHCLLHQSGIKALLQPMITHCFLFCRSIICHI